MVQWYRNVQQLVVSPKHKRTDSRTQAVIAYIEKHQDEPEYRMNKTKISDYMERKLDEKPPNNIYASIKKTYKIVEDLLEDKTIILKIDERNRRERHYYINDKSSYIQVRQLLSQLRKNIIRYNEPIDKINNRALKARNLEYGLFFKYKEDFIYSYYASTGLILRHLSELIKNMKFSEEDIGAFMVKIMELNEEFEKQIRGLEDIKKEAVNAMNMLTSTKNKLSQPSCLGQHYVNSKMIDETVQTLEHFNKTFLKLESLSF